MSMDKKIEKRAITWPIVLVGIGVLTFFGFVGSQFLNNTGETKLNVQADRLLIDTIHRGVFQEFIPVTGAVLPIKSVLIGAVEGGRVEERFVEDGTEVKKGQSILRLSNPDLQLSYLNQEATIVSQMNQIRSNSLFREQQSLNLRETALNIDYLSTLARKRLKRNTQLGNEGVIARVDVEELQDEFDNLERRKALLKRTIQKDSVSNAFEDTQMTTTIDLMQRNLKIARQSLDNLIVKSPIDGQISGLTAELGELINEGAQIAQIDDLTNFKIRVKIDEFYISRIYSGQAGSFKFANENYELSIKKIYPQVVNGAFEADMLFKGKVPTRIKRGQTITVKLELSAQEEALLLARGGFYQSTGGNYVYVLSKDGSSAFKQAIRVGRQNPNFYEVMEGLKPDDVVITSSYENFGDKDVLVLK